MWFITFHGIGFNRFCLACPEPFEWKNGQIREPAKATPYRPEGFRPDPRLRLREQVREVARFKQLSLRTEEAYWVWIRQFILFHGKRHPREMSKAEVESFLSHLAAAKQVAASTQNQALNAPVFSYREVLRQPFDGLGAVERPLRRPKAPTVLSREEAQRFTGDDGGDAGPDCAAAVWGRACGCWRACGCG